MITSVFNFFPLLQHVASLFIIYKLLVKEEENCKLLLGNEDVFEIIKAVPVTVSVVTPI